VCFYSIVYINEYKEKETKKLMEKEKEMENIERFKIKAELFLKEDIKAFVKDTYDNYYFCDIVLVGENWLVVKDFSGRRDYENTRILWIDVKDIQEYKEERI